MANNPYSETIIDAVKTAIEGITIQSGDNRTVAFVNRFDLTSNAEGKRPSVNIRWRGETKDLSGSDYNVSMSLEILAKLDYDPYSEESLDEQQNKLAFDIEQAIAGIDYSLLACTSPNFASEPLSEIDAEDPVMGVVLNVIFNYAIDVTNLYDPEGPGVV